MVSDLDRRGCHKAAEDCLDAWLDFPGHGAAARQLQVDRRRVLRHRRLRTRRLQQAPRLRDVGHGRALADDPRPEVDGARRAESHQGLRLGHPRTPGDHAARRGRQPADRVRLPAGRRAGGRAGLLVLAGHERRDGLGLRRRGRRPGRLRTPRAAAACEGRQGVSRRRDARDHRVADSHAGGPAARRDVRAQVPVASQPSAAAAWAGSARRSKGRCSC